MSDESAAPAEGAAAAVLATTEPAPSAATETEAAPAQATEAAPPPPDNGEQRRAIEAAKARRKADRERQERDRALAERETGLTKREQEIADRVKRAEEWDEVVANAKRNPLAFLERTGMTIDDLVRAKLNDGEVSPELLNKDAHERTAAETRKLREEIEALKAEKVAEREQRESAERQERAQRAAAQIQGDISKHIDANAEKYEYIVAGGESERAEVYKLIEGTYLRSLKQDPESPVVLSVEQAADMIEKYHEEQAARLVVTKKGRALWEKQLAAASTQAVTKNAPAPAAATKPDARVKASPGGTAPSQLTNDNVTSPASPDESAAPLEDREAFVARTREKLAALKKEKASRAK